MNRLAVSQIALPSPRLFCAMLAMAADFAPATVRLRMNHPQPAYITLKTQDTIQSCNLVTRLDSSLSSPIGQYDEEPLEIIFSAEHLRTFMAVLTSQHLKDANILITADSRTGTLQITCPEVLDVDYVLPRIPMTVPKMYFFYTTKMMAFRNC